MRGSVDEVTAYPLGTLEVLAAGWAGGVAQPSLMGDSTGACLRVGKKGKNDTFAVIATNHNDQ